VTRRQSGKRKGVVRRRCAPPVSQFESRSATRENTRGSDRLGFRATSDQFVRWIAPLTRAFGATRGRARLPGTRASGTAARRIWMPARYQHELSEISSDVMSPPYQMTTPSVRLQAEVPSTETLAEDITAGLAC